MLFLLLLALPYVEFFLTQAMWTRFFPAVVELRKRIQEGEIGEVKYIYANFGFKKPATADNARMTDPKLGGGGILDIGVYVISFATMVFGERPDQIHATGWLTSTGVDEFAAITLKYSGERVAQLACSINLVMPKEAVVIGSKGTLKLCPPFWCPTRLETPTVSPLKEEY